MTVDDQAARASAEKVEALLAKLTTEEKVNLVSGLGFNLNFAQPEAFETVPGAAGYTYPVPRLNIPSIVLADGPAGLRIWPDRPGHNRKYYATAFPIATALASTWDVDLLNAFGHSVGHEAREYGVDLWLAP
ncbi:MAG: beta-glucosidase, partial [Gammaproteobacteria bacterium]|nr:beta-glucosidase [Gammaproteobacteria bacterium]